MTKSPRRDSYRHGNLQQAALVAAYRLVESGGHDSLSMREVADSVGVAHRALYNHFQNREALLDAVAIEAFTRLARQLANARDAESYTAKYVAFALRHRAIFALIATRPHGTMKHNPPLQAAAHLVITETMRIFCAGIRSAAQRRRMVMKVFMIHYGGISLYAAGILDLPNEKALVAELTAMTGAL